MPSLMMCWPAGSAWTAPPSPVPSVRCGPAAGRKDRDRFISGKSKQNAVKTMVVTDGDGRLLFCSPAQHGSCADITHARQLGLVRLLDGGPALEILADAGYQGLGRPDRRARGDATASQVQEERSGLVRRDPRAATQGPLLPTHPRRARHRAFEELAGTRPPPRTPRAHERHRPSHRRPTVPPADRRPGPGTNSMKRQAPPRPTSPHPLPCTRS
ncbi:transposase family protein [Streptomyces collinus]|uniref:transposase family protein n=1 Tax=Streptomyces collinus TaxID=42684 RepID=UPI0036D167F2